ncbi:DUF2188 domain-containing protein [Enterococcus termitis]|uniref:DUF2188 domain-containing protein n=1 Tax=Enterococcus termitis TaxID=332950 RepID=A0A1E5GA21_9ENTE|nr:DUF2188 domain-containing protein [Enterococcus termitis]OEG09110.1 hypothetical protein BCR25_11105 [Enterococcus termitis]OJG98567.1 hypothetical protein RV18_GL002990 [Enterococcus termitis]
MPWDLKDYPNSFKNFEPLLKKKAIEIANALVSEGYSDDRAIPIAISQSKKWLEEATDKEKNAFKKEAAPKKTDKHGNKKINTELLDNDVLVYFKENRWYVQTKNAEKAVDSFDTKASAMKRAKEIAENKESKVIAYKKDEKPDL